MKRAFAAVAVFAATLSLVGAADLPLAPKAAYTDVAGLMRDMMPNYRSFWQAFRSRDAGVSKEALGNLASQGEAMRRLVGAEPSGSDLRRRTDDFVRQLQGLARDFDRLPRSRQAEKVLELYRTCQSCHEALAPAEGRKREYLPQI